MYSADWGLNDLIKSLISSSKNKSMTESESTQSSTVT